ncbi:MAG TPA: DUF4124 domain-containing protein [Burkholderiales bacterium]|nr:DUF4124 domain-containing protein [Burkholderiales bacterium]
MNTPVRLALVLALALGAAVIAALPAAAQQLYKYVGPDGKVQYSDRPPSDGRKAEKVTSSRLSSVPSAPVAGANADAAKSTGPKTAAEQDQAFRQRQIEAEEKAKKDEKLAQQQQQQAESCANARRELSGMQSGARVARLDANGERVFLDDAGVQSEISRLQREIASGCK